MKKHVQPTKMLGLYTYVHYTVSTSVNKKEIPQMGSVLKVTFVSILDILTLIWGISEKLDLSKKLIHVALKVKC